MIRFFTKQFFGTHEEQGQGCVLIDKIAALAQTSDDLNFALKSGAEEIGRALGLERVAILLKHAEGDERLAGEFSPLPVGPVQRERLRQLDPDLTRDLETPA